jgi:hypothetical protein
MTWLRLEPSHAPKASFMHSRLSRQAVGATVGHDTELAGPIERLSCVAQSGFGSDRRCACRDGHCRGGRASAGPALQAGRPIGAGRAAAGPGRVPDNGAAAGMARVIALRLIRLRPTASAGPARLRSTASAGLACVYGDRCFRCAEQPKPPLSPSAWQPSLASRANSETSRTKDPKQIDRAVDASFKPAFHLAVANQAIQSRPGPAIIGSLDQP